MVLQDNEKTQPLDETLEKSTVETHPPHQATEGRSKAAETLQVRSIQEVNFDHPGGRRRSRCHFRFHLTSRLQRRLTSYISSKRTPSSAAILDSSFALPIPERPNIPLEPPTPHITNEFLKCLTLEGSQSTVVSRKAPPEEPSAPQCTGKEASELVITAGAAGIDPKLLNMYSSAIPNLQNSTQVVVENFVASMTSVLQVLNAELHRSNTELGRADEKLRSVEAENAVLKGKLLTSQAHNSPEPDVGDVLPVNLFGAAPTSDRKKAVPEGLTLMTTKSERKAHENSLEISSTRNHSRHEKNLSRRSSISEGVKKKAMEPQKSLVEIPKEGAPPTITLAGSVTGSVSTISLPASTTMPPARQASISPASHYLPPETDPSTKRLLTYHRSGVCTTGESSDNSAVYGTGRPGTTHSIISSRTNQSQNSFSRTGNKKSLYGDGHISTCSGENPSVSLTLHKNPYRPVFTDGPGDRAGTVMPSFLQTKKPSALDDQRSVATKNISVASGSFSPRSERPLEGFRSTHSPPADRWSPPPHRDNQPNGQVSPAADRASWSPLSVPNIRSERIIPVHENNAADPNQMDARSALTDDQAFHGSSASVKERNFNGCNLASVVSCQDNRQKTPAAVLAPAKDEGCQTTVSVEAFCSRLETMPAHPSMQNAETNTEDIVVGPRPNSNETDRESEPAQTGSVQPGMSRAFGVNISDSTMMDSETGKVFHMSRSRSLSESNVSDMESLNGHSRLKVHYYPKNRPNRYSAAADHLAALKWL